MTTAGLEPFLASGVVILVEPIPSTQSAVAMFALGISSGMANVLVGASPVGP